MVLISGSTAQTIAGHNQIESRASKANLSTGLSGDIRIVIWIARPATRL